MKSVSMRIVMVIVFISAVSCATFQSGSTTTASKSGMEISSEGTILVVNAANQFGMEKDTGSLETDKHADFVVLDRNPLKVDPDEIRNIHGPATVRGGMITYSDVPEYDRVDLPKKNN